MIENCASAAILVNDEGKVLIILRSNRVSNFRGFWCFPGGSVDDGESAKEAASRECMEEVGLDVPIFSLIHIGDKDSRKVNVSYFVTDKFSGTVCLNDESDDYRWVEPEELDEFTMIPFPKNILYSIISYCRN